MRTWTSLGRLFCAPQGLCCRVWEHSRTRLLQAHERRRRYLLSQDAKVLGQPKKHDHGGEGQSQEGSYVRTSPARKGGRPHPPHVARLAQLWPPWEAGSLVRGRRAQDAVGAARHSGQPRPWRFGSKMRLPACGDSSRSLTSFGHTLCQEHTSSLTSGSGNVHQGNQSTRCAEIHRPAGSELPIPPPTSALRPPRRDLPPSQAERTVPSPRPLFILGRASGTCRRRSH